jgi:hypothetical protein
MDDNPSTTASELIPLPALPTPDSFPFPYPQPYDIQLQLMQTVFRAVEEGKIAIVRRSESGCDSNRPSVADKLVLGGEPDGHGEELDPADRDVDVVGREPEAPGHRCRGESSSASLSGRPGWWVRCIERRLKGRPTMGD